MLDRAKTGGAERIGAGGLKVEDHLLRQVLVLAEEDVDVVAQDRARVAGVTVLLDAVLEGLCNDGAGSFVELQQFVFENVLRAIVEGADLTSRGLDALASVVELPE